VEETDGSEASDVMISVLEVEKAPLKNNPYAISVEPKNTSSPNDGPTRFSAQPLPLGGKYLILAHRRHTYAASEVISVTEQMPIQTATFKIPPGVVVKGRVLGDQGQPLPRVPVELGFVAKYSHSFGSQPILTDEAGWFQFEGVNPAAPGSYHVTVRGVPGFQPANRPVHFDKSPLVITLRRGVSVAGVVLDRATAKPIPSAKVRAYLLDDSRPFEGSSEAETRPDGRFLLDGLDRKTYQLFVTGVEMEKTTIRAGVTTNVTLQVKPSR
jgi:hypothetical protein